MNNTEKSAVLNSNGLNDEVLENVAGGKKKEPVGPVPRYNEGQRFRKYWPTTMNWTVIEIVRVTDEFVPGKGFKYIVIDLTSRRPDVEHEMWLEEAGSPWEPTDRPIPEGV